MTNRPTVLIACRVFEHLLGQRLSPDMPVNWLDADLHNTPRKLNATVQGSIDAIAEPSTVILGYGLCGNGLLGIRAGHHWLVIPRMHDCVAMFIGSHQRYLQRFFANPTTYYLTKGWLDAKDNPLGDWHEMATRYDEETADYIVDMKYRHYRTLCLVGSSEEELESCRPVAKEAAAFCAERFGMEYEEIVGSTELAEALLAGPSQAAQDDDTLIVVAPGGEVTAAMFLRAGEVAPPTSQRKGQ